MLTALLMQAVADLSTEAKIAATFAGTAEGEASDEYPSDTCDITVADILGPLLEKEADTSAEVVDSCDRARDANFSLLSYSYSLVGLSSNLENHIMQLYQSRL